MFFARRTWARKKGESFAANRKEGTKNENFKKYLGPNDGLYRRLRSFHAVVRRYGPWWWWWLVVYP